jgi:hypothetical protein
VIVVGQLGLAASLLFVAGTRSPWGLTAGLALAGTTSGVACAAAQGVLVADAAANVDAALVRWALFSSIGDVLAPLVTAAAIALGLSYRGAMLAVAATVLLQCAASARLGQPEVVAGCEGDAAPEPLGAAIASALRRPRLWLWLLAAASCTLLDEIVVALSGIRLVRDLRVGAALAAGAAVVFAAGSVVGSRLSDPAVARFGSRRVLVASAALCAAAIACLAVSPGAPALCCALAAVGVTCAPHHALSLARAYEEVPQRPGVVQACAQVFVAVDVGAPLALGVVADRFGARVAIACLALQPAIVLACARLLAPRRGS